MTLGFAERFEAFVTAELDGLLAALQDDTVGTASDAVRAHVRAAAATIAAPLRSTFIADWSVLAGRVEKLVAASSHTYDCDAEFVSVPPPGAWHCAATKQPVITWMRSRGRILRMLRLCGAPRRLSSGCEVCFRREHEAGAAFRRCPVSLHCCTAAEI
jgi:hypothetical protein